MNNEKLKFESEINRVLQDFEEIWSPIGTEKADYINFMLYLSEQAKERADSCMANTDLIYFIEESPDRESNTTYTVFISYNDNDEQIALAESDGFYDYSDALQWLEINYPDAEKG